MATVSLLFQREYTINDDIHIIIPTVGEIMENEDEYYNLVSFLTASPIDMMVQLDDVGIDFTTINDYELFLIIFDGIRSQNTNLIFGDLDLSNFKLMMNKQNNMIVLYDQEKDIVIDRGIHGQIAAVLRKIHHIEKD